MEALEYISDEESVSNMLAGSSSSSCSKTPFFPSLSSLTLLNCPDLKGLWRNSDDDNEPHHLLLPSFPPCLSKTWLKIYFSLCFLFFSLITSKKRGPPCRPPLVSMGITCWINRRGWE